MARFTTRTFAATALATAMFAVSAGSAFAQAAAPAEVAPAASAPAPAGAKSGERGQRMTPEQRQDRMAKRADAFKQKLKITADQEPAWNAFQQSMQPNKDRADQARLDRKEMDKLTTPERIDRMRAMHAQRSAEMDRRGEAVKTFYATLKPEQQKVFDEESKRMMHRFGHGGEHGHHKGGEHRRGGHDGKHHQQRQQGKSAAPATPAVPTPVQ
ncbi:Spy/CpxP family protein refolding chaperone [Diaphorobacter aerolatus]|uniref:Spy/CpxP family protein refolding chaperone n=1 Tax=Diaphorobacter aerolatus TaxID=1288495 RepID=A0A7H0GG78_9BURK|nr:Spy/CpxP family protein refolding chaperone [Diaphorobacter aerolatus]QNP47294.1 Spy/CpxP family protein refolding chaperone [Diaphorobacter aerolatus]